MSVQLTAGSIKFEADQFVSNLSTSEASPSPEATTALGRDGDTVANRFGNSSVFAATARQAGRLNASSISKEEEDSLIAERKHLLDKHFAGTISRSEANKLQYVRWSLDRIDDAREGIALDNLERMVTQYENLSEDIRSLRNEIERSTRRR